MNLTHEKKKSKPKLFNRQCRSLLSCTGRDHCLRCCDCYGVEEKNAVTEGFKGWQVDGCCCCCTVLTSCPVTLENSWVLFISNLLKAPCLTLITIVCIAEDFERVEYPDSCHFDPHFAELVFHECFGFVQIDFSIDFLMDLEHF